MTSTEKAKELLLESAHHLGGYESIRLIAAEGIRRLEASRAKHRKDAGRQLTEAFADLVSVHGDVHAAIFLKKCVTEYQRQLGGVGMGERAQLWERVARSLEGLIRDARK
jgi:hypothetical protein